MVYLRLFRGGCIWLYGYLVGSLDLNCLVETVNFPLDPEVRLLVETVDSSLDPEVKLEPQDPTS